MLKSTVCSCGQFRQQIRGICPENQWRELHLPDCHLSTRNWIVICVGPPRPLTRDTLLWLADQWFVFFPCIVGIGIGSGNPVINCRHLDHFATIDREPPGPLSSASMTPPQKQARQ